MIDLSNRLVALLSDETPGGAAVAANRLAAGLAKQGVSVEHWFFAPDRLPHLEVPQVQLETSPKRPWPERLLRNFSRPLAHEMRRRRHERLLNERVSGYNPALLHLHNLHASGLGHSSLLGLPARLPLVWTLHDCWVVLPQAFEWTDPGCERRRVCVDPAGRAQARANRSSFFAKRPGTVLVAPSRWMHELARAAVPASTRVELIPYGVPVEVFRPLAQREARGLLGLPGDRILLGIASTGFDARKGGDILATALGQLKLPECEVVVWGNDSKCTWPGGVTWHRFGLVTDESRLATLYSACDFFICPSRIDNLPNTILESLSCGTPVLASAVGGIPDMVRPGQTGWLYEGNRPESCANALHAVFREKNLWAAYRERCRAVAVKEFSLEVQAQAYLRVYDSVLRNYRVLA